jgi:hypothetical protein
MIFRREWLFLISFLCCSIVGNAQNLEWIVKSVSNYTIHKKEICSDENNNIYEAGRFYDTIHFDEYILTTPHYFNFFNPSDFIAKFSSDGKMVWALAIGTPYIRSMYYKKGYIYLAGSFSGMAIFGKDTLMGGGGFDGFFSKMDTAGNFIWTRTVSGNDNDYIVGITVSESENVFITGSYVDKIDIGSEHFTTNDSEKSSSFVAAYDSNGNFLWANHILEPSFASQGAHAIAGDNSGIYVAGGFIHTVSMSGGNNHIILTDPGSPVLLIKYSHSGELLWAKIPEGTNGGKAEKINIDLQNLYLIVNGKLLNKYSQEGNLLWSKNFPISNLSFYDEHIYIATVMGNTVSHDEFTFSSPHVNTYHAAVAKYTSDGIFQWFVYADSPGPHNFQAPYYLSGCNIETTKNGNIFLSGGYGTTIDFFNYSLDFPMEYKRAAFLVKAKDVITKSIFVEPFYNPICSDTIFPLIYNSDTCLTQNRFYAQLSDSNGDFTNGIFIGDTLTQLSGVIKCIIPDSILPGNYKLRVVASNPHTKSNEVDITIKDCITSIKEGTVKNDFSVFPNPAKGNITISSSFNEPAGLLIRNTTGAIVFQDENFKAQQLNIKLSPGLYFIELQTENERLVKKVVVNK